MVRKSALAWLLLAAFATNAEAQDQPSGGDTIVVTGTKPTKDAVATYVGEVTAPVGDQIASFHDPICPGVFGLPDAYKSVVEGRLREIAAAVGLRTANGRCDPNLVVLVTDSGGTLIRKLRKERPDVFGGLSFAQVDEVLRAKGPVHSWQAFELRGADGRPLDRVSLIDMGHGPQPVSDGYILRGTTDVISRTSKSVRRDIVSAFISLDVDAIDGLTLTQIADYSAMRTLAKTRVPKGFSGPSILGLFEPSSRDSAAPKLTKWDLAYLRELYATQANVSASSQRSAISGAIRRDLDPGGR